MDATQLKYNLTEIATALGIDGATINKRKAALVKAWEIEAGKGKREYTYDEVKKLAREPRKPGQPRPQYIDALKRQLINDGFTIKKP